MVTRRRLLASCALTASLGACALDVSRPPSAQWSAAASPQDVELSGGLLLDLGHAMARSEGPDVAARGTALLTDLMAVTGQSPPSGDAHRRRRLVVLDTVARLASLAEAGTRYETAGG